MTLSSRQSPVPVWLGVRPRLPGRGTHVDRAGECRRTRGAQILRPHPAAQPPQGAHRQKYFLAGRQRYRVIGFQQQRLFAFLRLAAIGTHDAVPSGLLMDGDAPAVEGSRFEAGVADRGRARRQKQAQLN
jgi:hypothetical protein